MNYCERIPVKTEVLTLNGENAKVDTHGKEAVVAVNSGTVYLKANAETANGDAFTLKEGERIALNGSFYLDGENASVGILYCAIV